jgi:hypothetical protein
LLVRIHYQVCTSCGAKFNATLHPSTEIRVGPEFYACACGAQYRTGKFEWAHLNRKRRRDYFISSAEIGIMLLSMALPVIFGYGIGPGWQGGLVGLKWGFLFGLCFIALLWSIKALIIRSSLRRVPYGNTVEPIGILPWHW